MGWRWGAAGAEARGGTGVGEDTGGVAEFSRFDDGEGIL